MVSSQIKREYQVELSRTKEGQRLNNALSITENLVTVYGAAQLLRNGAQVLKSLRNAVKEYKASNSILNRKISKYYDDLNHIIKTAETEELKRIKLLSAEERLMELGINNANNQLKIKIGEQGEHALLIEKQFGYFKSYEINAEADYVSLSGMFKNKVVDVFGLPPNVTSYPNYPISKFYRSIDRHFSGKPNVEILVLDMRFMKLEQEISVITYIKTNYMNSKIEFYITNKLEETYKIELQ